MLELLQLLMEADRQTDATFDIANVVIGGCLVAAGISSFALWWQCGRLEKRILALESELEGVREK